jgi:hypothetical protein
MSRSFKGSREFVPADLPEPPVVVQKNSAGFLDIVAKFGPLLIAIIAVAFCFYIYKKVVEMDKTPNTILQTFIQDQTQTNFQIQESYNAMVEQFNNLCGVVHTSLVKSGTIETQISPSPSIINESLITTEVKEVKEVEEETIPVPANEILDDVSEVSEVSVTLNGSSKPRRGRKPKNEVNFKN